MMKMMVLLFPSKLRASGNGCAIDLCCGATFCAIALEGVLIDRLLNATLKEGEGGRKSNPKLWVSGALGCNLTLLSRKSSGFEQNIDL